MLFIANDSGSAELVAPLKRMSLPAELLEMKFGDVAFVGRGIGGKPVDVGIELKKVNDLIGSLRTQRLQGLQGPGMQTTYDYRYLLIEGEWRVDKKGLVIQRGRFGWKPVPGKMTGMELEERLLTFGLVGGFNGGIRTTNRRADTLRFIAALYRWWTDRDLDDHKSHLGIYTGHHSLVPMSDFRKTAYTLPGVGMKLSLAAQQKFKSLRRAFAANASEWSSIETKDDAGRSRRFGDKEAQRLIEYVEKEH